MRRPFARARPQRRPIKRAAQVVRQHPRRAIAAAALVTFAAAQLVTGSELPTKDGDCTRDVLRGTVTRESVTVDACDVLVLDPERSTTLTLTGNLIVHGVLEAKPARPDVVHTIRFIAIDEEAVVGGGMDPIDSDVGLWVMGAGQLDIAGTARTGWTNLADGLNAGATSITLAATPVGWRVGDELVVVPTKPGTFSQFEGVRIAAISGATVTLDRPLVTDHPHVAGRWTAEVLNLTRNVRIEGTAAGRAHVFIRSSAPQTIRHASLRYLGPRPSRFSTARPVGPEPKWLPPMDHTGRYALHFHASGDGSRGSVVEGTVVRDAGNHAYVPHLSNGITFHDTISWNTQHTAYWWDGERCPPPCNIDNWRDHRQPADPTFDTTFDHVIAARVRSGSANNRLAGFDVGKGTGNRIVDSVAVGVDDKQESSGFHWPEANESVWRFERNLAHNNGHAGIFVWQNSPRAHVITDFDGYHNELGIEHGAYKNHYLYEGGHLYANARAGILLHAVSDGAPGLRFERISIEGGAAAVETTVHRLATSHPTTLRGLVMRGYTDAGILLATGGDKPDLLDVIDPTFDGLEFRRARTPATSVVRVQLAGTTLTLTPTARPGSTFVATWNLWRTEGATP